MVLALFLAVLVIFPFSTRADDTAEDSVFMCTEKPVDSLQRRMVYGYIDGQKTECMTEQQLLSLFSEKAFQEKQDSINAEKKKKDNYFIEAIAQGQKDLKNADLRTADLMNVKMKSVDFSYADLSSADLRDADLSGSILRNADLSVAFCKDVNFSGADLTGAKLDGAYLNGANLSDVRGLTYDALRKARTVHEANLAPDLLKLIEQNASHLLEKPKQGWIQNTWAPADSQKNQN
ncbi:MAG: pentapeptide repeat-containing protein [Fibrobacterota bacterium]